MVLTALFDPETFFREHTDPSLFPAVVIVTLYALLSFGAIVAINIWVFAVKHARALTLRQALLTTAIPLLVYLGYSLLAFLVLSSPTL